MSRRRPHSRRAGAVPEELVAEERLEVDARFAIATRRAPRCGRSPPTARVCVLACRSINHQRQERSRYLSTDQPPPRQPHESDHCSAGAGSAGQSKQHAGSAGWVDRRSVVAALNVGGLPPRRSRCRPTDAGSERPAGREGDRRAEQRRRNHGISRTS